MLKTFSIGVMVISGFLLLACLTNKPKESRYYGSIAAAILFSGGHISLAVCSSRDKMAERITKETS